MKFLTWARTCNKTVNKFSILSEFVDVVQLKGR